MQGNYTVTFINKLPNYFSYFSENWQKLSLSHSPYDRGRNVRRNFRTFRPFRNVHHMIKIWLRQKYLEISKKWLRQFVYKDEDTRKQRVAGRLLISWTDKTEIYMKERGGIGCTSVTNQECMNREDCRLSWPFLLLKETRCKTYRQTECRPMNLEQTCWSTSPQTQTIYPTCSFIKGPTSGDETTHNSQYTPRHSSLLSLPLVLLLSLCSKLNERESTRRVSMHTRGHWVQASHCAKQLRAMQALAVSMEAVTEGESTDT